MPRLAWLTDPHLNFLTAPDRRGFYRQLQALRPNAVLLGGDIGEAETAPACLVEMAESLRCCEGSLADAATSPPAARLSPRPASRRRGR